MFGENRIQLATARLSLERFQRRDGEILLVRNVLDRQLIDVDGRRVIRVNNLALSHLPSQEIYQLVGVDISFKALLRRIFWSFSHSMGQTAQQMGRNDTLLDWGDIEYLASNAPAIRLNVNYDLLARFHPADMGRLLEELSYKQRIEIVQNFELAVAADALEAMKPEFAADILESLDETQAADILEQMEPEEAADVVAELNQEIAGKLLEQMEPEEAKEVQALLAYAEGSVGSIMTNNFVTVDAKMTIAKALRFLREQTPTPQHIYSVLVVEPGSSKLTGIVTLTQLATSNLPHTIRLEKVMQTEIISTGPTRAAQEAAQLIVDYHLLVLPVVEEGTGRVVGIVTLDKAVEQLLQLGRRKSKESRNILLTSSLYY